MLLKNMLVIACLAADSFALGQLSVTGLQGNTISLLHTTTLENLSTAMHSEAFAHAKYLLFAQQEGNCELASLFTTIANADKPEHLAEQARMAGLVGSEVDKLKNAIADESYTAESMCPDFAAAADRV